MYKLKLINNNKNNTTQQRYLTTNKTLDTITSYTITIHTNLIIRLIKTPSISH